MYSPEVSFKTIFLQIFWLGFNKIAIKYDWIGLLGLSIPLQQILGHKS